MVVYRHGIRLYAQTQLTAGGAGRQRRAIHRLHRGPRSEASQAAGIIASSGSVTCANCVICGSPSVCGSILLPVPPRSPLLAEVLPMPGSYRVGIVGLGVAGATAGYLLARDGHRV